ncbi:MAG: hypothetical protein LBG63_05565, partial [Candidatus Methanoplasma sp.]|nr:hypothetical protein [Candidatus Methanoplasma sp.]
GANSPQQQYNQPQAKKSYALMILGIACFAWAIFALYDGIYTLYNVDGEIEAMKNILMDAGYENLLSEFFEGDSIRNMLIAVSAVIVASGALSAIAGLLCITKRLYIVALITCIIASVLALIFLVGIIGFIVAYFIYKNKDKFVGEASSQQNRPPTNI